jgi:TctA family transporter
MLSGGDYSTFITRPISLIIAILTALVVGFSIYRIYQEYRESKMAVPEGNI